MTASSEPPDLEPGNQQEVRAPIPGVVPIHLEEDVVVLVGVEHEAVRGLDQPARGLECRRPLIRVGRGRAADPERGHAVTLQLREGVPAWVPYGRERDDIAHFGAHAPQDEHRKQQGPGWDGKTSFTKCKRSYALPMGHEHIARQTEQEHDPVNGKRHQQDAIEDRHILTEDEQRHPNGHPQRHEEGEARAHWTRHPVANPSCVHASKTEGETQQTERGHMRSDEDERPREEEHRAAAAGPLDDVVRLVILREREGVRHREEGGGHRHAA